MSLGKVTTNDIGLSYMYFCISYVPLRKVLLQYSPSLIAGYCSVSN